MTKIYEISIVVPVYNSSNTLEILIDRLQKLSIRLNIEIEIILVNDSSRDNSWEVISKAVIEFKNITGINLTKNLGQIKATNKGIEAATGKYIVTIDDDLEYPPIEITKLYTKIIEKKYDVVFGIAKSKYNKQGKNEWFANLRNKILNKVWKKPPTDSFKIFKKSIVYNKEFFILINNFEALITKNLKNIKIGYVEVDFNKRLSGNSNYTLIKKIKFILEMNKGFKN